MGPMGLANGGLFAPKMDADVVYSSSHSPFTSGDRSAPARVGLRRSSADAAASTASTSSSDAETPRFVPSMASRSAV